MVAYEKGSKAVLSLGPPDPAFIERGEQNFVRFATAAGLTWGLAALQTLREYSRNGSTTMDWSHL
jgi:glutathione S-transferase